MTNKEISKKDFIKFIYFDKYPLSYDLSQNEIIDSLKGDIEINGENVIIKEESLLEKYFEWKGD